MRVVAGRARGRHLVAPPGRDVRPTGDRVRESMFNALGSLGAVDGAEVLDLFAGTGALGIEALSRGAARATFVESDARAREALTTNLDATGFTDQATVIAGPAERFLANATESYSLALLDPPYAFDGWSMILGRLSALAVERVVIETDRDLDPGPAWEVVRSKWYGTTLVVIARRHATAG